MSVADDGARLLVVTGEAEEQARTMALLSESDSGIAVEKATTLSHATELLGARSFDVVMLDLELADPGGLEMLRQFRDRHPDVAILAVAPAERPGLRDEALDAGANELVAREDLNASFLTRCIRYALERFEGETTGRTHREKGQLLDANPDAVLVVDAQGVVRYVNPAARSLFANGDELVGEWLGVSVGGDFAEVEILGHSNPRTGEIRVADIEWQGEHAVLVSIRDVTETRRLAEQLREAQKLEVTGLLAGGLAHDFNNLLVVIMGNVEFLRAACDEDDPRLAMVDRIDSAAERARQLTRQLLMFSRRQPKRPAIVDPGRVLLKLFSMLRRSFPSDIELVVLPASDLWHVHIDPNEFDQVLMNLAFNARQAMPGGGRIHIDVANETLAAASGRLQPGDYVAVRVRDEGVGIAAEDLEKIFDAFYTTRSSGTGTGLGLTICQTIARRAGGDIHAESTLGEGSTFTLYLPRSEADEAAPEPAVPAQGGEDEAAAVAGKERILLVEDDTAVAESLETTLRRSGYATVLARDGAQAKRLLEQEGSTFDLVLSDAVMPIMNGLELSEWLASSRPAVPFLLMTGYTDEIDALDRSSPGRGLLYKPFLPSQLLRAIRAMLDGRTL